jgi:WbqC-like protein family
MVESRNCHISLARCPKPVVAIHQPNFLPWLGYFQKMALCDRFIYLDTAPFTRNGLQNRNRIVTPRGEQWLTVPVLSKGHHGDKTSDIRINHQVSWQRKHLKTLQSCYGKADHWDDIFPQLSGIYSRKDDQLVDFNYRLLHLCRELLGITTPVECASRLPENGVGSERLLSLIKAVNGKTYLSGSGGQNYLDEKLFAEQGITLIYQAYQPEPYPQLSAAFIPGMSVVDALFCLGSNTKTLLTGGRNA